MGPFDKDSGYNMALGEGESTKVTSLEMAGIYSAMERGGKYVAPTCIESVEGWKYDSKSDSSQKLYEEDTSKRLNKVMKNVFAEGTASRFRISGKWANEIAGKTGTTQKNQNIWLCGYSKEYTTAVWSGYSTDSWNNDTNGRLTNESSGIWKTYMDAVHKNMEFDKSKDKLEDEPSNKDSDEFLESKGWFEEKIDEIEENFPGHDEHKTHDPNHNNNPFNPNNWGNNGQNRKPQNNQDPNNQDPNNQNQNRPDQQNQDNDKKNKNNNNNNQDPNNNNGHE